MKYRHYARIFLKNLLIILVAMIAIETYKTRHLVTDISPLLSKYERVPLLKKGFIDLGQKSSKPKVLYFFAPWCPICKEVSSNFEWIKDDADIVSIALSWSDVKDVENFVAENQKGDYPVALGSDNLAADFRVDSFPSFYFLHDDGSYSSSSASYVTRFGLWWRVMLAKIF